MTIGKKLLLGYGFVLALLLIVIAVATYAFRQSQNSYGDLVDVNAEIVDRANAMARSAREQVAHYGAAVIYVHDLTAYIEYLHAVRNNFDTALETLRTLTPDTASLTSLTGIAALYEDFKATQERALHLLENPRPESGEGTADVA